MPLRKISNSTPAAPPGFINVAWQIADDGTTSANVPAPVVAPPAGAAYTLPVATPTLLGGVKSGNGVYVAGDGTLTAATGRTIITTASETYAVQPNDFDIQVSAGGCTVLLPASATTGETYYVSCTSQCTIDSNNGNLYSNGIAGGLGWGSSKTMPLYAGQFVHLYCVLAPNYWFILDWQPSDWITYTPSVVIGGVAATLSANNSKFQVSKNRVTVLVSGQQAIATAGTGARIDISLPLYPTQSELCFGDAFVPGMGGSGHAPLTGSIGGATAYVYAYGVTNCPAGTYGISMSTTYVILFS
jgi:hypothetical protein